LFDYEKDAGKIERLTVENLELQNTQLRRATPFAIIGFIIGVVASGAAVWAIMK
jgi:hypothetical protein